MTTYTPIARLPVMTPRDPAVKDAWGDIINNAMPIIEQVAAGVSSIDITGTADQTPIVLSTANDAPDQARQAMLLFVGTAATTSVVIQIPQVARIGWVSNQSNVPIVLGTLGGSTSLTVPPLGSFLYRCDGAAVVAVPFSVPSSLLSPNGVLVNNAKAYAGNDASGTARNMLEMSGANATTLFAGPTGLVIRNLADTTSLVIVTPTGAVTVASSLTVTGALAASGTVNVNGAATFNAGVTISAGGIQVGGGINALSGAITTTGRGTFGDLLLTGGNIFMNNGATVLMKDAGGTFRSVLNIGVDNNTNVFNAGGGNIRFLNQAGTLALLSVNNAGSAVFAADLTTTNIVAGVGTIGGVGFTGAGAISAFSTPNMTATIGNVGGVVFSGGGVINTSGAVTAGSLNSGNTNGTVGTIGGVVFPGGAQISAAGPGTIGGVLTVNGATAQSGNSAFMSTAGSTVGAWNVNVGITAANWVTAAGFATVSDQRLKTQIEDLTTEQALAWIRLARPRRYLLGGRTAAGFLAQEDLDSGRGEAVGMIKDDRLTFAEATKHTPPGHRLVRHYEHDIAYLTMALRNALDRLDILEGALGAT